MLNDLSVLQFSSELILKNEIIPQVMNTRFRLDLISAQTIDSKNNRNFFVIYYCVCKKGGAKDANEEYGQRQ